MSIVARTCPLNRDRRCGGHVADGYLLCPACWLRVPKDLRSAVNRTWAAWSADLLDPAAAKAYRSAAEQATSAARHAVPFSRGRRQ